MSTPPLPIAPDLLKAVRESCLEAGAIATDLFRPGAKTAARTWSKSGGSPVTEADIGVDTFLRIRLSALLPEAAWLSEETVDDALRLSRRFVWVVDPIDGTSPFLNGQPNWCVSIGVRGPEGLAAGVIEAPVLRETYVALAGQGATLNGRPLRIDPAALLTSANIGFGATQKTPAAEAAAFVRGLYDEGGVLFRNGSGALMLAYVAAGRLAGYYDPGLNAWDCYAGLLLVREAGGVAEYLGSDDMLTGGLLYCGTPAVVADLRRLGEASRRR